MVRRRWQISTGLEREAAREWRESQAEKKPDKWSHMRVVLRVTRFGIVISPRQTSVPSLISLRVHLFIKVPATTMICRKMKTTKHAIHCSVAVSFGAPPDIHTQHRSRRRSNLRLRSRVFDGTCIRQPLNLRLDFERKLKKTFGNESLGTRRSRQRCASTEPTVNGFVRPGNCFLKSVQSDIIIL